MRSMSAVAALGMLFATLAAAQAQRRIDPAAAKLPDGDGKIAVIENCAGVCHPASRFVNLRKSPDEWHRTVMSMVARGAQLFPEDVVTLTNYLGTYLSDSGNAQQDAKPQDAKLQDAK